MSATTTTTAAVEPIIEGRQLEKFYPQPDGSRIQVIAPTDIAVGKITYPAGEEMSFPFSPDEKLSVYTGEFPLTVVIHPLTSVAPGKYLLRGELKYQACDNAACYPPKKLPVEFEVKVVKAPPPHRSNPAQSPHVHG